MRYIFKSAFISILSVLLVSCMASKKAPDPGTVILPLSDTVKITDGSLVYGLPRTVISFVVEMEHSVDIPGPYAKYAEEMLGLTDAILSETESWDIRNVEIRTHEEIDPSEYYIIKSSSLFQTNVLAMRKEGLILDLNPRLFNQSTGRNGGPGDSEFVPRVRDMGSDEYFQSQSDTVYRRVAVDSSFVRIPYIVEKKKKLTTDQMAEKAARRLMEMREGKHLILTGEANVFPQSDAAIVEMNRIEKEYTELFTGKSFTETRSFTFTVIPEKEMEGKPVFLFSMAEERGPSASENPGGEKVNVTFISEKKTKDLTIISGANPSGMTQIYDKLFYRVPDVVNISISIGNETLASTRKLVFQFGELVQLPANYLIGK